MRKDDGLRRRDVLKTTGGILGGMAVGGTVATSASAQPTYFRYDRLRVRLVDVDSAPPRFLTVESSLYLSQALLSECDTDHPCSIDVLDYNRADDDDDDNGDNGGDDDDNDENDDDDDTCPGYASVVLLCHADSASESVVMTGLIRDVLRQYAEQGADYIVDLTPTTATNISDPERVANPCPDDDEVDDEQDDDDAQGDDDPEDNGGDDDTDDQGDDQDDDDTQDDKDDDQTDNDETDDQDDDGTQEDDNQGDDDQENGEEDDQGDENGSQGDDDQGNNGDDDDDG